VKQLYASLIAVFFLLPLSAAAGGVPWGEPNNTPGRFIVLSSYSDEAVFDSETGLVWERSPSRTAFTWANAQIHCNQLNVGNRKGWRLPTIQELASLVDGDPANTSSPRLPPGDPFISVLSSFSFYWSATTFAIDSGSAWGVFFGDGGVGIEDKSNSRFAWCVRGGQGVDPQ
jgi:hypothetical protein